MKLRAGDIAPDFELPGVIGEKKMRFHLAEEKGKRNVVLAFYPVDWSPV